MRSPVKLLSGDSRVASPGFLVTRTWRPAGFRLPSHSHEYTNVSVCIAGAFDETLRGKWHHVTTASLICRPAGEPHANSYGRGASRAVIFEVRNETLASVSSFSRILHEPLCCNAPDVVALAGRIRSHFDPADELSPLILESLGYELIAFAALRGRYERREAPAWLNRARDLIHAHFPQSMTLDRIATVVDIHPAHLARAFRRHFGQSIGEYVRDLRTSHAARLLRQDAQSVADIAATVGFYDQSHFTRVFKRRFGISPARFRRSARRARAD